MYFGGATLYMAQTKYLLNRRIVYSNPESLRPSNTTSIRLSNNLDVGDSVVSICVVYYTDVRDTYKEISTAHLQK